MPISTDNFVDDFVLNTSKIFEDNRSSLGLKEVFRDDVVIVSQVPSLAVSCTSMYNTVRTLGSTNVRYEFLFIGELWYYHSSISPDVTPNLVMSNAYRLTKHILQNASLNGWLTNTRALVRSCNYSVRPRSQNLFASARIKVLAPYQTRIANIS